MSAEPDRLATAYAQLHRLEVGWQQRESELLEQIAAKDRLIAELALTLAAFRAVAVGPFDTAALNQDDPPMHAAGNGEDAPPARETGE